VRAARLIPETGDDEGTSRTRGHPGRLVLSPAVRLCVGRQGCTGGDPLDNSQSQPS